jgi:PPP family 3-phenylpropionic acid transporter
MAVGALAEVLVMVRFFGRPPPAVRMLPLCFGVTAIRVALTGLVHDPVLLIGIQVVHALSFGVWYLTSLATLSSLIPERWRATGQALFTSTVFGIGGGAGTLLSGFIFDWLGSRALFLSAAGASAVSVWIVMGMKEPTP